MDLKTVRRCSRVLEPLHSLIYFAPEHDERFAALGLKPGRMCYLASRAAPMGPVGPEVVTATFYNFNPDLVARHIPAAWQRAAPADILRTRLAVADAVLRRFLGDAVDSAELAEAAELAATATAGAGTPGRPLYAGHRELDWPTEPHLRLWHAVTLLREYRGDGHLAALQVAGLAGLPALIMHTATGRAFTLDFARASRGWSEEQWAAGVAALREKDLLDADGRLTEAGAALREEVEQNTDRLGADPFAHLGEHGTARLAELAKTFIGPIIAGGAFPATAFASS
jgi:hypothetical protein